MHAAHNPFQAVLNQNHETNHCFFFHNNKTICNNKAVTTIMFTKVPWFTGKLFNYTIVVYLQK